MKAESQYEDITEVVGYFEGHPIERTCTAQEQREAVRGGIPLSDFLDYYFTPARCWQADC